MNSLPSNTSSISKGIFFLPVPYKRPVAFGSGLIEYIFLHESSFFKFIIVIQISSLQDSLILALI